MKYEPYEYQSYASRFILEHPYCGLILDMGLGKTVITLTALFALALDYFTAGKILVIAPKRVAEDTWPKELKKWEHLIGMKASLVVGTKKQREQALAEAGIQLYGGVSGNTDDAVQAFLSDTLSYNPDVRCSHHDEHEHGKCGEHGCGEGHCSH